MKDTKFSINLKKLRNDYGLTQEELGEILNLTKAQISFYERGMSYPKVDLVTRVAQYFNVPLTQLIESSIRSDFYFREVVTGQNTIIKIPTIGGIETLNGVPGLIEIPAHVNIKANNSLNPNIVKYANFMLLFPEDESDIAQFFYKHFDKLHKQDMENLFKHEDWVLPKQNTPFYDGYPLLYQLLWASKKGAWLNSTLARPATDVNILALALPQNDKIIRLYILPEKNACRLHATYCLELQERFVEWLQKNEKERKAIAQKYCLEIMKEETALEDLIEEEAAQNDDYDGKYNLKRFLEKRGIEPELD